MEKESWEAGTSSSVDDHAAEPPAQTWWPDQEGIYLADGDSESVGADGIGVGGSRGRLRDERTLFRRRGRIRELDFQVGFVRIS